MEDDNSILIGDDILKAISFNGGISGTTSVIVDAENIFDTRSLNKHRFKTRTGAQETHELFWEKDLAEVTSNVSVPEIIPQTKIKNTQTIIYL